MQTLLMEAAHWGLALIPVLVLLAVFEWLDAFELVNIKEILVLLLLGGIAASLSWPVSGRLLDTLPIGFSNYSRFVAPWIEEAIKGAMIVALFRMNRIGYKLDAVIAGFAIGAGFSVVENIIYLLRFPDYATGTWLSRRSRTNLRSARRARRRAISISISGGSCPGTVLRLRCTWRSTNSRTDH